MTRRRVASRFLIRTSRIFLVRDHRRKECFSRLVRARASLFVRRTAGEGSAQPSKPMCPRMVKNGSCLPSGSGLISGATGCSARANLHAAHWCFRLPCGQPMQSLQLPFSLPCGQGLQFAQFRFSLPCGQGLQSAQKRSSLPCGQGLQCAQPASPCRADTASACTACSEFDAPRAPSATGAPSARSVQTSRHFPSWLFSLLKETSASPKFE